MNGYLFTGRKVDLYAAAADGKYHVTLHGLNPGSDVIRCVVMDDAEDLAFEVERFKRFWRKRGYPFVSIAVEPTFSS